MSNQRNNGQLLDSRSQSLASSVERWKRQFRSWLEPVLLAPAGVLGFHYVEGEHMARELRAVQFTLMDNFPVDENESTFTYRHRYELAVVIGWL